MITIYFDRGRRMVQVFMHEVASTVEHLVARGYTVTAAEHLTDAIMLSNFIHWKKPAGVKILPFS